MSNEGCDLKGGSTIRIDEQQRKAVEKAAVNLTIHHQKPIKMSEVVRHLINNHLIDTVKEMKEEEH